MPVTTDPIKSPTPCAAPNSSLGSTLCTRCGLCCTGALHDAAVLDPDEVPHARKLGLPVLDRKKPGFGLPCPALNGTLCSVYGNRPKVCGQYKCKLLTELEAGEVAMNEALERVETAKTLAAQTKAAMPVGMTLPEARTITRAALSDVTKPVSGLERVRDMELRLRSTALDVYLDKYFRNTRDARMFELNSLEPTDAEMEK